jgi:hypothetical protein
MKLRTQKDGCLQINEYAGFGETRSGLTESHIVDALAYLKRNSLSLGCAQLKTATEWNKTHVYLFPMHSIPGVQSIPFGVRRGTIKMHW